MTHTAGLLAQPDRVRRFDEKGPAGTPARRPAGAPGFARASGAVPARAARRSPTLHLVPPASLGVPVCCEAAVPAGASGRTLTRAALSVAPGQARVGGAPC